MTIAFLGTLLLFFLIILPIGAFFLYLYWWSIQRSNPQQTGTLTLACLTEAVEVLRDKHGVPHLYAQNRADLFRAQGFVHAQDRLWQMEQNRRIAQGRLAAVYGEAALDADRFSRIIGFWRAAEAELPQLDAETHQVLTWYAEGVNGYIEQRPRRLGGEFNLLRVHPAPWTPLDSLGYGKVMGWGLSLNWESELTRLQLLEQLDPFVAAELEPSYPEKNPIIAEGVGDATAMRLQHTAGLLLNQYEELKQWLGVATEGEGSNAWVLAPQHSLNRRPLLCNDPHLAVQIPGTWYELHLNAPDYAVSGVSLPGTPGVVIGHNEEIAWGMTNAMVDVQDLYWERAHPTESSHFAYGDSWESATVREETIEVRRRAPHVERVVITRHGPLISNLVQSPEGKRNDRIAPLALRWSGHEPGQLVRSILRLNQATNWEEFSAALTDWSTPVQNVVFADSRGNIGYRLAGKAPLRAKNLGLLPAPGWLTDHEWQGYIPAAELPHLYNPESGKIVTANHKLVGDDYPYFLGVEFDAGWRAARLEEMLKRKDRYTIRDMEEMQLDTHSKLAEAFTPWFTLINSDDPWEKTALQALRKWNFRMDADNFAATVYHHFLLSLLDMVFGDKLGTAKRGYLGMSSTPLFLVHGFLGRAETRLLELLQEYDHSFWYTEVATGRQRDRETLLQEALRAAVRQIRTQLGDSTRTWDWGRVHQVRYVHPLGSARLLKNTFQRGPIPVGGDGTTPNVTRHAPQLPLGLIQVAASYRQIYEVGVWDRAQTITNSGQSGHPLHPNYDDQIMLWREGAYHKMPWSRAAVQGITEQQLLLKPA
ncbi:MAG: penicillin acylase family protein [Caldilineaceae bacterium]|nr:penicillin acylase family protein [Caldilineaceae bacterium]